jgi:CRISPR type III-A-associated RAMP protein Csm5
MELFTVSPVFIGSGKSVDQHLYINEGDGIIIYDETTLLPLLNEAQRKEYRKLILDLSEAKAKNVETDKQPSLSNSGFMKDVKINPIGQYYIRSGQSPITGEIQLFQHGPLGFYIPGSSIKGAIRQLLLISALRKYSSQQKEKWKNEISQCQDQRDFKKKHIAQKLEKQILSILENGKGEVKQDPLHDLMRAVRVSDSQFIPAEDFEVISVQFANMEKPIQRNQQKKNPGPMQLNQLCLKAGVNVRFNITLDSQLIQSAQNPLFTDITDLLQACQQATELYENQFWDRTTKALNNWGETEHTPYIMTAKKESWAPNFILGGNTGFDRHTFWPVFEEDLRNKKIAALPPLPKSGRRDRDQFLPRTCRLDDKDLKDYLSFGWCQLKAISSC